MKHSPTDLDILNAIYNRYYDVFASYSEEDKTRSSKIYVPIDFKQLAIDLNVDPDIIFGRLYYHLEEKFGYKQDDKSSVHFFSLRIGGDSNCVNFPYLASVLASLREENRKYRIATRVSVVSLIVSIIAILISILFR